MSMSMPKTKKILASKMPLLPPSIKTARETYEKTLKEYRDIDMPLLTMEERKQMMTRMLPFAVHFVQMVLLGEIIDAKVSDRLLAAQLAIQYTVPKPQNEAEKEGSKTMGALKSFLLEQGHVDVDAKDVVAKIADDDDDAT